MEHGIRQVLARHGRASAKSKAIRALQATIARRVQSHPRSKCYFLSRQTSERGATNCDSNGALSLKVLALALQDLDDSPDSAMLTVSGHIPTSELSESLKIALTVLATAGTGGRWAIVQNQAALLLRLSGKAEEALCLYKSCGKSRESSVDRLALMSGLLTALTIGDDYHVDYFWEQINSESLDDAVSVLRLTLTAMRARGESLPIATMTLWGEPAEFVSATSSQLNLTASQNDANLY